MSTPTKKSTCSSICSPIIDVVAKLHQINQNHQDCFYNVLASTLQVGSLALKTTTNVNNPSSIGLASLAQSINSSRILLRGLSGISSVHLLIQNKDTIKSLLTGKTTITTENNTLGEKVVQFLQLIQPLVTILFNITDVLAYISTITPVSVYDGPLLGRLSCLFWFINSLCEVIILAILRSSNKITYQQCIRRLVPLCCDCVVAANWSVDPKKAFLSEFGITALCTTSAWANFAMVWEDLDKKKE
jgi:hypothetical protein